METSSATSGSLPIIHMKMRPTLELGSSPALCSTAANLGAPVQNTPPSPTVVTAPASLTPSNAARAQHAVSRTPVGLTASGGVSITTTQQQHVNSELAPPPRTSSCREPPVHALLWRLKRENAVDNVTTSPPKLALTPVKAALWRKLTPPVKMSVEQLVGIVEDHFWRSGASVRSQARIQQQQLPAVLVEQSCPKITPQIMTTIMMKSGP